MTDATIWGAADAWCADEAAAAEAYGDVATWETGGVTNMEGLFSPVFKDGAATVLQVLLRSNWVPGTGTHGARASLRLSSQQVPSYLSPRCTRLVVAAEGLPKTV